MTHLDGGSAPEPPGVAPSVLAVAETLNLCLPSHPGEERVLDPRWARRALASKRVSGGVP